MIAECKNHCEHPYQDQKYGKWNRLHNNTLKSGGSVIRCTVCSSERSKPGAEAVKKGK